MAIRSEAAKERARQRVRDYYAANKDKILQKQRDKQKTLSLEERQRIRAVKREYEHKNKDRSRKIKKAYRAANPEKFVNEKQRERNRRYHHENREKITARKKEYLENNPLSDAQKERGKETRRNYYLANKENWEMTREKKDRANFLDRKRRADSEEERIKHCEEVMAWYRANPSKVKATRLKVYGITLDEFIELLAEQGGKCAICGYSDMSNPKIFPFVDHCHSLKHVRGILCCHCNHALGHMKDSPALLRKAAKYLEKTALFGPPETNRESEYVQ